MHMDLALLIIVIRLLSTYRKRLQPLISQYHVYRSEDIRGDSSYC